MRAIGTDKQIKSLQALALHHTLSFPCTHLLINKGCAVAPGARETPHLIVVPFVWFACRSKSTLTHKIATTSVPGFINRARTLKDLQGHSRTLKDTQGHSSKDTQARTLKQGHSRTCP